MPVQKIGDVIASSGGLKALSGRALRLIEISQILLKAAPPALAAASRVTDLKAGTLVLLADNPAVAAKLRQLAPRLLSQIQQLQAEVTGIRVDVQVKPSKIKAEHEVTKRPLPPEAIKDFETLGEALPPSPLKSALDRLVARRGPNKPD